MAAIRDSAGDRRFRVFCYIFVTILLIIVMYPLIYVISASVSDPKMVASGKIILLPKGFTLEGYRRIFQDDNILTGYANTIFYTTVGTMINLAVTVTAGYALARRTLPGRRILTTYFLIPMYFSGGLIPTFLLVNHLGLYNTRAVMVLIYAFNMYYCIMCRTFFCSLPKELEEAAVIDGSTPIQTFLRVVLPLSKALLGVMVLYFSVEHWNTYFIALIYLKDQAKLPLQLVLRKILVLEQTSANMLNNTGEDAAAAKFQLKELIKYAVIIVSSLPVLILYPFLQKYFVQGVMIGSVKG
ncbi:MAG: carbohydrate ABC transporter permease [Clostridiaceae bacterium]